MKLHHFRDVVTIAEQGSLRAAARHLGLAQPALSRSLAELERELGASLFERQARGMVPTPAGGGFLLRATAVGNELSKVRAAIDQLGGGVAGRVTVGLSMASHIALLPPALTPFRRRYPDVQLDIIEGYYPTLESGLRDGRIDFYIGPRPDTAIPPELQLSPVFENMRVVLCRRGHPMQGARSIRELVNAEWATTSITMRAVEEFRRLFESHGLTAPRLALRSQSGLTLMVAVASSDILAMVPVQCMDFPPMTDLLAIIPLREVLAAPTIVIIRRASLPLTPAATHLADLMLRAAPSPADGAR